MGDPHQRVVDRVDQGVERLAVGADDGVVRHVAGVEHHVATHQVVERDLALGHPDPQHVRTALGLVRRDPVGGEVTTEAVVADGVATAGLLPRLPLLGGAVARVGGTGLDQLVDDAAVDLGALGLAVRAVRSADVGALVPGDAEPVQRVEDIVVRLLGGPGNVGVLDPEHQGAAVVAREGVVEQRGADIADMQVAGR
ncbi:hypothetical protein SDC9_96833 [bioreactor metagenome]|uniref:Uncharacterized protein n=1 Tax=bioreactor metagenome TaxID=1076179 RepID=A0A645ABN3_9ZZZZ